MSSTCTSGACAPKSTIRSNTGLSIPCGASVMSFESTIDPPAERTGPARHWSLAVRLTVWYSVSAFVLVVGSTSFLYWALTTNLDREDDGLLLDKVAMF